MKSLICLLLHIFTVSAAAQTIPRILCYHQVRSWRQNDDFSDRIYITSPERFHQQLQVLHDSGYHTILPDELVSYWNGKTTLPAKSVMITFDDGTIGQYITALPELERFGFKAVFLL